MDGKNAIFFLFINEKSGGNRGKLLTSLNTKFVKLTNQPYNQTFPEITNILVYLTNLCDEKDRKLGISHLKNFTNNKNNHDLFAVACGGDGTVMWVIEECISEMVDLSRVAMT